MINQVTVNIFEPKLVSGKEDTCCTVDICGQDYFFKRGRRNYNEIDRAKEILTERVSYQFYQEVGASDLGMCIIGAGDEPGLLMKKIPYDYNEVSNMGSVIYENTFVAHFVADAFSYNRDANTNHLRATDPSNGIPFISKIDFGESLIGLNSQIMDPYLGLDVDSLENLWNIQPITVSSTKQTFKFFINMIEKVSVKGIVEEGFTELISTNSLGQNAIEEIIVWKEKVVVFLEKRQEILRSAILNWLDQKNLLNNENI